ncbi:hypothetical protein ES332_D13G189500v1 [Gossypium tomentosum]|uniref:Uncharacterized protein n=1 Tax=Gossypium tomentosum TaxID=34277 RepID=A0A5D2HZF7_GOSTO|nr:hypothetical protein ES332_D13G189500v1 [Gossypium tomentosum]
MSNRAMSENQTNNQKKTHRLLKNKTRKIRKTGKPKDFSIRNSAAPSTYHPSSLSLLLSSCSHRLAVFRNYDGSCSFEPLEP